ncbi:MAG: OmpA family protein [Candidatus Marinimicrobia bacterium]|nr:OmpA family protein [Candidatus Neomarinimicrobiota bacterium]MCF7827818.1 OmpA family protein [Candidatus Neomarinimicrobiota bacterium]MCF7879427.1 OmpA family protein [Candidatus Neomarinimicrobiota bacterium]
MDESQYKNYNLQGLDDEEDSGDAEPWLLTYGDMMTLLMTFFVLLFAMSSIDPVKLEQFAEGVGGLQGASKKQSQRTSLADLYESMKEIVQEENLQDVVNVESGRFGVKMNIPSELTFSTGQADMTEQLQPFLRKLVPTIKNSVFPVAIIGHTDSDPIRTAQFPSNWELSASRSSAVARFFIDEGVQPNRLIAIGKGDTEPLVPNTTPENKAKNRRVEIQFLTESL